MDPACLGSAETPIIWAGRTLLVCLHHARFVRAPLPSEVGALDPLARRTVLRMQPLIRRPAPPPREPLAPQPPEPPRFCSRCGKRLLHRGNLSGVCTPCQRANNGCCRPVPEPRKCRACGRSYNRGHNPLCSDCSGRYERQQRWRAGQGWDRISRRVWIRRQRAQTHSLEPTACSPIK
jgi:hypothetical protein